MATAAAIEQVHIEVSLDGLFARLNCAETAPGVLTRDNIIARLVALSIPITDDVERRISEATAALGQKRAIDTPVVLAEGKAAMAGYGPCFTPAAGAAAIQDESGRVDYHHTHVITAEAGEVIGTLTPAVKPAAGEDVFGKRIAPPTSTPEFKLGKNVSLCEDGKTVKATVAGKVHMTRQDVSVLDVVDITGDVDLSTGNIDSPTDVLIRGTVRESFKVKSACSVTINGALEAADVEAGTDVHVHGGIAAHSKGKVIAGREILAKFCEGADLHAGRDITIARETLNSTIYTLGRLDASRGEVVGGSLYAREGAQVKELGNEAGIPTRLAIGIDPRVLMDGAETHKVVKKKQEAVAKIREKIQPLIVMMKRLTPAQREQATELMFQADQMVMDIQEQEQRHAAAVAAATPEQPAVLRVTGKLYPGVTVICGDKQTVFRKEHRGPLKILRRQVERTEEIVAIDEVSGSVSVLISSSSLTGPGGKHPG